ncbi:MAG: glutamine--fructose-6-phosphate transaminase (isomerizing) [Maricaulaceae bacterium]
MCGIIGIAGRAPVAERLVESLRRLEYRGYDSAGIAVQTAQGLDRRRAAGKLRALETLLEQDPIEGTSGIGHTRWATHGAATETNAHPHSAGQVTLIHNGIIENYRELKESLEAQGRRFETETDTEAVAHLIDANLAAGLAPQDAVSEALKKLDGAFALAILIASAPGTVFAARRGSPLVLGFGEGETYLGSDAIALAPLTHRVAYLEEGDWAVLTPDGATLYDADGRRVERDEVRVQAGYALAERGNYRHFMEKEIHEQPEVVGRTLAAYVDPLRLTVTAPEGVDFANLSRLTIAACGTAALAGRIAKYWFERLAGLPVDVEAASEFRYRDPVLDPSALGLVISQSGETADTLTALRYFKAQGLQTAAIVNAPQSSMAREADVVAPTLAGPEIGVASTKAFTCQLAVLAAMAVAAGRARGAMSRDTEIRLARVLLETPRLLSDALGCEDQVRALAHDLAKARDVLYVGRGAYYPLALEGALKLKEISYIHAEGFAAGELKHGPIALIDEETPVIVLAPYDAVFEKTASNLQEAVARGARAILISDATGLQLAGGDAAATLEGPHADPLIAPIVYAAPIQLLAYHTSLIRGTDVDQPRNLAKSVTVE